MIIHGNHDKLVLNIFQALLGYRFSEFILDRKVASWYLPGEKLQIRYSLYLQDLTNVVGHSADWICLIDMDIEPIISDFANEYNNTGQIKEFYNV